jgi:hypothetical protein
MSVGPASVFPLAPAVLAPPEPVVPPLAVAPPLPALAPPLPRPVPPTPPSFGATWYWVHAQIVTDTIAGMQSLAMRPGLELGGETAVDEVTDLFSAEVRTSCRSEPSQAASISLRFGSLSTLFSIVSRPCRTSRPANCRVVARRYRRAQGLSTAWGRRRGFSRRPRSVRLSCDTAAREGTSPRWRVRERGRWCGSWIRSDRGRG